MRGTRILAAVCMVSLLAIWSVPAQHRNIRIITENPGEYAGKMDLEVKAVD